jgi:hypothetical protein
VKPVTFEIPAPLYGYRASLRRALEPAYIAFKDKVRLLANAARVPPAIPKGGRAELFVQIFWKREARIDGKNVYAAVEDGLFTQDRKVMDGRFRYQEHAASEEYVLVTVRVEEPEP